MADIAYKQLQAEVTALAKEVRRGAEAIQQDAKYVDDEATDTARIADSIASLKVDQATVAETREVSKIMAGLSEAVLAYAAGADTTARQAQAVHAQNHTSHDRLAEAFQRSTVGHDIYSVDRTWITPE